MKATKENEAKKNLAESKKITENFLKYWKYWWSFLKPRALFVEWGL